MATPLEGLRVIEMAAIGPVPFAGMLLADMGADVLRIDRPRDARGLGGTSLADRSITERGKRHIRIDLKRPEGVEALLELIERGDVLLEGSRPGVMERLGLGPEPSLERNARLIYGRMTGWGQTGPLARTAGHDINYIALAGVLSAIGRESAPPTVPLNLIGDYGGGGLLLAFGVLCAVIERGRSGVGQVIDAAMFEGAALLATTFFDAVAAGRWTNTRGSNYLDSGSPYYDVYETADGRYVAVGAIEQHFHDILCDMIGVDRVSPEDRADRSRWPTLRERFAAAFRQRTRDEWTHLLERTDACVTPVLDFAEAPEHPHAKARQSFVVVEGVVRPAPAPRFSRSLSRQSPAHPSVDLEDWGLDAERIESLRRRGILQV